MLLDENWVEVSTTGALVQRQGTGVVSLAYASATPTTEDTFILIKGDAQVYPEITGKSLYARSLEGSSLTVESF